MRNYVALLLIRIEGYSDHGDSPERQRDGLILLAYCQVLTSDLGRQLNQQQKSWILKDIQHIRNRHSKCRGFSSVLSCLNAALIQSNTGLSDRRRLLAEMDFLLTSEQNHPDLGEDYVGGLTWAIQQAESDQEIYEITSRLRHYFRVGKLDCLTGSLQEAFLMATKKSQNINEQIECLSDMRDICHRLHRSGADQLYLSCQELLVAGILNTINSDLDPHLRFNLVQELEIMWRKRILTEDGADDQSCCEAKFRTWYAQGLCDAVRADIPPFQRISLVESLSSLYAESGDQQIRQLLENCAVKAMENDLTVEQQEYLSRIQSTIGREGQRHSQMRLAAAMAKRVGSEVPPRERLALVKNLRELYEESEDAEVKRQYTIGTCKAIQADLTVSQRLTLLRTLRTLTGDGSDSVTLHWYSKGLEAAIQPDMTPRQRSNLVRALKALWEKSRDSNVWRMYIIGIRKAIQRDMPPAKRLSLVRALQELWDESKDPVVGSEYAVGAWQAIHDDLTPDQRLSLVVTLKRLWEESEDLDVRTYYAKGAVKAIQDDTSTDQRLQLVEMLKGLWEKARHVDLQIEYSDGIVKAIHGDMTSSQRLLLVNLLHQLWQQTEDQEIKAKFASGAVRSIAIDLRRKRANANTLDLLPKIAPMVMENSENPSWQDILSDYNDLIELLFSRDEPS